MTLHLRVRLTACLAFSAVLAISRDPLTLMAAAPLVLGALVLGWPGRAAVLRGLGAVNVFILLLWLVVPFSGKGEVLHTFGPLTVRADGLQLAWLATARANAIACLVLGMVIGSPLHALIRSMEALRLPKKLCSMLFFCARYIYDIKSMHQQLHTAAALRGYSPGMNWRTWRTTGNMFAMTVVRTLDQAHRVYQAMQLRGYDGSFRHLPEPPLRRSDWLALAGMAGWLALLVAIECGAVHGLNGLELFYE
ncbi:energy-coupling factor transporter transmembrane component T family protein [Megalodesulfovibrio paquesii]